MWCRSHNGVPSSVALVLSAKGRLFSVVDEGLTGQPGVPDKWMLVARDAFNGTLLWKKKLPKRMSQKAVVAVGERVYLALGRGVPVEVLDWATGETVETLKDMAGADELVVEGGAIVAHCAGGRQGDASVVAVHAENSRLLWRRPSEFMKNSLAATDGRVCYHDGKEVICLDLLGGDLVWRAACEAGKDVGLLMIYRDVVFVAVSGGLRAYDATKGTFLWKGPGVNKRLSLFGCDGLVWLTELKEGGRTFLWTPGPVVSSGYDPKTGEVKRTVEVPCLITPGHHVRCYPAKATDRYLLLPKRGVEFVDLKGEDHMRHDWFRGPCGHGVMPANGLLYVPPHQCLCYMGVKLTGFNAMSATASTGKERVVKNRLERGPAYRSAGSGSGVKHSEADWPAYRHDVKRSGRAGCKVPAKVEKLWTRKLSGRISQPVVADGRLVLAEEEAHTVCCLDAVSGKPLWEYTAGGRIDSAPVLHRGLVIFGSTDGNVYCLRGTDGALVWRFFAAPAKRRIVVHSQLESAWPVHGSVLVQDDVVYCSAGRSSYLDGGIWVYGLDVETGKVLHKLHLEDSPPDVTREAGRPFDMDGAKSDLLVSDGEDLYMFFVRMSPELVVKEAPRITKLGDREVSTHLMSNAGFLDTSWFDRNYWTYGDRWPGYYFGYNAGKVGQILSFDDELTYGLHVFTERQGHSPRFWPGKQGYELFADLNENELVLPPIAIGREKGDGYFRMLPPKWCTRIPVRGQAMVLAGERLYVAGPPDVVSDDDPMAAFEGRLGARLWVMSTSDGTRLAEYELDYAPVFDGMIAAQGRLYIAGRDGHLTCMGEKL